MSSFPSSDMRIGVLRSQLAMSKPAVDESALETDSIELSSTTLQVPAYLSDRPKRRSSVPRFDIHPIAPLEEPNEPITPVISLDDSPSASLRARVDEVRPEVSVAQAVIFRRRSRIHFAALCWFMFLEGWNDGSIGPLLPAIQGFYHVSDFVLCIIQTHKQ